MCQWCVNTQPYRCLFKYNFANWIVFRSINDSLLVLCLHSVPKLKKDSQRYAFLQIILRLLFWKWEWHHWNKTGISVYKREGGDKVTKNTPQGVISSCFPSPVGKHWTGWGGFYFLPGSGWMYMSWAMSAPLSLIIVINGGALFAPILLLVYFYIMPKSPDFYIFIDDVICCLLLSKWGR